MRSRPTGASWPSRARPRTSSPATQSSATTPVAGDKNAAPTILVRDRVLGTPTRVSVDSGRARGNGASQYTALSADGRLVAFQSLATNLVAGDTNGFQDIFVRD